MSETCAFIVEKCKEFNKSATKTLFVNSEGLTLLSSKHFIAIRVSSTALCIREVQFENSCPNTYFPD